MALIKCAYCGKAISSKAKACPQCGQAVVLDASSVEEIPVLLCEECGIRFHGSVEACPNCGCPAPEKGAEPPRSGKTKEKSPLQITMDRKGYLLILVVFAVIAVAVVLAVLFAKKTDVLIVELPRAESADGDMEQNEKNKDNLIMELPGEENADSDLVQSEKINELQQNPLYYKLQDMMGIDFQEQKIAHIDEDKSYMYVYLANSQLIPTNIAFEMGDGSRLQFPLTYGELRDAGWMGDMQGEITTPLPVGKCKEGYFVNHDGKMIYAEVGNYSSQPIEWRKAAITRVSICEGELEGFSVNGITFGATVEEILGEFGLPYGCFFSEDADGTTDLCFWYMDVGNYSSVEFDIDPETGLLDYIVYLVIPPYDWNNYRLNS